MTEWRALPGFSDYAVSDDGMVRPIKISPYHPRVGVMKLATDAKGYHRVTLISDEGQVRRVGLHVAVLEAFVGPRPPLHDGSHLNGKRADNRLSNLAWETSSENHQRKLAHGTLVHGEKHKCSKLTIEQVREIRARSGERLRDIGAEYGVSGTLVSRIRRGLAWPHAA